MLELFDEMETISENCLSVCSANGVGDSLEIPIAFLSVFTTYKLIDDGQTEKKDILE